MQLKSLQSLEKNKLAFFFYNNGININTLIALEILQNASGLRLDTQLFKRRILRSTYFNPERADMKSDNM